MNGFTKITNGYDKEGEKTIGGEYSQLELPDGKIWIVKTDIIGIKKAKAYRKEGYGLDSNGTHNAMKYLFDEYCKTDFDSDQIWSMFNKDHKILFEEFGVCKDCHFDDNICDWCRYIRDEVSYEELEAKMEGTQ